MRKKVMAALTAVMVLSMSSMTVFAAGSVTTSDVPAAQGAGKVEATATPQEYADNTTVTLEDGTEVKPGAVTLDTLQDAVDAVQNIVNDKVTTDGAESASAEILSVVDIPGNGGTFTIAIVGINAGDDILVLHWNGAEWEEVAATVGNGEVTISVDSNSPFVVARLTVSYTPVQPPVEKPSGKPVDLAPASSTGIISPRTGEAMSMTFILAAACLAGAIVSGKKVKVN